jgi:hypothetical protein
LKAAAIFGPKAAEPVTMDFTEETSYKSNKNELFVRPAIMDGA